MQETINNILVRLLGRSRLDPERVGLHEYHRRLDGLPYARVMEFQNWLAERKRLPSVLALDDWQEERRKAAGRILPARALDGVGYSRPARTTFGQRLAA